MSTGRLLIVDDDPVVLTALPETLRLWMPGLMVDLCGSARLALDRLETTEYDAVVSDIRLPDMDGLALLERIKSYRPHVPVLLVTGYGDQTLATQALRGGAFDYILKPIDRDYFLGSLNRALQLGHLSRQAQEGQRTETALRESRLLLDTLIETVPCPLIVTDREGRIILFNRAAESLTGYTREEVLNSMFLDKLISPDSVSDRAQQSREPLGTVISEVLWRTKSGKDLLIEWRTTPIHWLDPETPCVLGAGTDMTERMRAEDKIAALHAELTQQRHANEQVVHDLQTSKEQLHEKIADLEIFQEVVVGRELKMIALEKQTAMLQRELDIKKAERPLA